MQRLRSASLAVIGLCWACSSATDSRPEAEQPKATAEAGVLESCLDFASRLCVDAEPCCLSTYGTFDADGCLATLRRDVCRPAADAVAAGRASYDAEAVEPCLLAHARAHAVCVPTWSENLELRREIYTACRSINGTTPPGQSCTTDVTCERPSGLGTTSCVKNRCRTIEILPEGANCEFPSGEVSVCDAGLTCSARGLGATGTCVAAAGAGNACDASVLESTECGLGSYCDLETQSCKVTENRGGGGCRQSTECVSFDCDRSRGECAPAEAVVSRATCGG
jgi:hypothetical protein